MSSRPTGQWIEAKHAGTVDARLDRMLAAPDRPVLAWVGIKGGEGRTVHVKGQGGERTYITHDHRTFGEQIRELAERWGTVESSQTFSSASEPVPDADEIYARRRDQASAGRTNKEQPDRQEAAHVADQLPDADDIYSRRRIEVAERFTPQDEVEEDDSSI